MSYLLQNDDDILDFHEFETEQEARDFARDNIIPQDISNWTLFDPEGADWCL
jgi:hypothetical protein